MKRKCPHCKSKDTSSVFVYKRDPKTREVIDMRQDWVCNRCDGSWTPGQRKAKP